MNRIRHFAGRLAMFAALATLAGTAISTHAETPPRRVKNIILMIGDGMGFNQVYAADLYEKGAPGAQRYEHFPVNIAMSTWSIGKGYDGAAAWSSFAATASGATDSAAAATAMATGFKTYDAAIGMIGASEAAATRGKNVVEFCEARGMATGVVSTVPFSHATPAGFVAHNVSRNNNAAIAQEMLRSSAADVIMGAGHPDYDANGQPASGTKNYNYVGGAAIWESLKAGTLTVADANHNGVADDGWTLIDGVAQFQNLATTATPPARVCGVARVPTTLQQGRFDGRGPSGYYRDDLPGLVPFNTGVPTLTTMTLGALNVLSRKPNGFFLMIEGGAIDWAGHSTQKGRIIEEQMDFNRAVEAVIGWIEANGGWGETLLIVTGDHETGLLWGAASNPLFTPLTGRGVGQMPDMKFNGGGHTNQLVPFFAKGPFDAINLLHGYADQVDPLRGKYLDNTELGQAMIGLVEGTQVPVALSSFNVE